MLTIKIVDRVLPMEPEEPETPGPDWMPRRWAGARSEWHAGFESVASLGKFSILPGDEGSAWVAARTAFGWMPDHGFEAVHMGEFNEHDQVGHVLIGHKPGSKSEVFVTPSEVQVFILGPDGKTIDRV